MILYHVLVNNQETLVKDIRTIEKIFSFYDHAELDFLLLFQGFHL